MLSAKNVLTFDEVATLTGLSKSHLYKLTCKKVIPHYKPSGKIVY
ncbi:MAG: helix-turn-helix domain-containing protein, partial [Prevotellaceae bacterium]|nr:helix-turn-helix domain-containing protein [Prevotellaceae bacterium]